MAPEPDKKLEEQFLRLLQEADPYASDQFNHSQLAKSLAILANVWAVNDDAIDEHEQHLAQWISSIKSSRLSYNYGGGTATGVATGVAVGTTFAGPVGTLVGAAVGAIAGGLVGHGIAEGVNPTVEDAYWRDNYRNRPYVSVDRTYDDYQPAYRYGWESRAQAGNTTWEAAEPELSRNWNDYNRGAARQTWDEAKHATKDAWHRIERALPGDADADGR